MSDERDFFDLAASTADDATGDAPARSRLRSRLLTTLLRQQAESGPLMSLSDCKGRGGHLCVFEELVVIAPVGEANRRKNPCNVCQARLLAEQIEGAPIWWPGCPYSEFQKG